MPACFSSTWSSCCGAVRRRARPNLSTLLNPRRALSKPVWLRLLRRLGILRCRNERRLFLDSGGLWAVVQSASRRARGSGSCSGGPPRRKGSARTGTILRGGTALIRAMSSSEWDLSPLLRVGRLGPFWARGSKGGDAMPTSWAGWGRLCSAVLDTASCVNSMGTLRDDWWGWAWGRPSGRLWAPPWWRRRDRGAPSRIETGRGGLRRRRSTFGPRSPPTGPPPSGSPWCRCGFEPHEYPSRLLSGSVTGQCDVRRSSMTQDEEWLWSAALIKTSLQARVWSLSGRTDYRRHTSEATDAINQVWSDEKIGGLHAGVLQKSTRVRV